MPFRSSSSYYQPTPRDGRQSAARPTGGWPAVGLIVAFMVVGVVSLDLATPQDFRARALLGLVPIVVGMLAPVVATATITGLLLATYIGLTAWQPTPSGGIAVLGPLMIGTGGLLGVLISRRREEQHNRLRIVTDIAEATQRAVMRVLPERIENVHIADFYQPAARSARVGGDWYDFQPSPHGLRAVLGDVSGKGLAAVSASSALLAAFREAAYHEAPLPEVARRLEIAMQRYNAWTRMTQDSDRTDAFSTALLLHFPTDPAAEYVDIVDFGHEPPLVISPDGLVHTPDLSAGLPLGMGPLGVDAPAATRLALRPGDTLVLFTDGVTECRDADGVFYPVRERMARLVTADTAQAPPGELLRLLAEDLHAHRHGPPADDAAITVIRRTQTPTKAFVGTEDAALYEGPRDVPAQAQYATDMRPLEWASRSISSTKATA
ncbi:PP2C family protein-serine/threonine phosphatase [Streptomyces sp. NPDC052225]|uniref:PP2C family protein-serine/threonine phosphatase n=1 Tax=Streptomyces sp. NPDC052225 TaxID=3154949 RepID=UPI003445CBA5